MSASRRFPRSRFQPGIAARYACTGASPSAFAICGLPPESRTTGTFSPFRTLIGLAPLAPGLAFAPAFGGDLYLVADARGVLARDVPSAFGFALPGMAGLPFLRRRAVLGHRGLHERLEPRSSRIGSTTWSGPTSRPSPSATPTSFSRS